MTAAALGDCVMGTTEAEQIVTRFVAAWERADVDELLDYFAEDAVWHPIPMRPTVGKAALQDVLPLWLDGTAPHSGENNPASVRRQDGHA
jgi:ketosteroid isomerase-like protein